MKLLLLLLLLLNPWLVTEGCSGTLVPFIKRKLNLILAQQYLPTAWKEAAIVSFFEKANVSQQIQTLLYSQ
jgi:hypothetical protein